MQIVVHKHLCHNFERDVKEGRGGGRGGVDETNRSWQTWGHSVTLVHVSDHSGFGYNHYSLPDQNWSDD